jgi:hypothetical protein
MSVFVNCVAFLMMFLSAGSKLDNKGNNELIKGKLVYSNCGRVVVQVKDAKYYYLCQSNWQHSGQEPECSNVFTVRNSCAFLRNNIRTGELFYFKVIKDAPYNNGCTICLNYDNVPNARVSIDVVRKEENIDTENR